MKPPIEYIAPEISHTGIVLKKWGYEKWIVNFPLYCAKILHFNKNCGGSLHYHLDKTETWYIQDGQFAVTTVDKKTADSNLLFLNPGDTFHIPRGTTHSVYCTQEGNIFEVSTLHHEEDSYRIRPSISA